MKKVISLFLAILIGISALGLTGCGKKWKSTIKVYNWGDYIDKSVIDQFEKEYDIKVSYSDFATNEEMYAKMKAGGTDYDVAIPSDYMIKKMEDENMLEKINLKNVPNYRYIEPRFKNLNFDPDNEYSVPYMWGTVGILYNKSMVKEPVDSWNILWNKKYSKQIFMLDSQRDSIGITLKLLGYSLNSKSEKELEAAKKKLIKQKPLVLAYVGDEVKDKMIGNEAALAVVWSGDAVYMKRENKDLEYVIPKEGSNLWFDSMVVLKGTKHKKEAEKFVNFMCRTDIALKNAKYIGYATPQNEAKAKLPKKLTQDKTLYPEFDDLKDCEVFSDLSDTIKLYDRIWTEVQSY
ncbi:MAG TPA: ABC transporter substrate-binding protein [Clostridia bacterium]|nr:ABC transporter substrate-binding protein [Clostridia bacterium]